MPIASKKFSQKNFTGRVFSVILSQILHNVDYEILQGSDCEIKNLTIDSRQVVNGSMFFCIRGLNVDGHKFIDDVAKSGAVCIMIDRDDLKNFPPLVTIIKVKDVRCALAFCSSNFFDNPAEK